MPRSVSSKLEGKEKEKRVQVGKSIGVRTAQTGVLGGQHPAGTANRSATGNTTREACDFLMKTPYCLEVGLLF